MQLNTVLYQLFAPKPLLGPNGAEDWQMIAIGPSPDVVLMEAQKRGLTKFALAVTVCIGSYNLALQSPPANATPV